jgi:hypothetical protein
LDPKELAPLALLDGANSAQKDSYGLILNSLTPPRLPSALADGQACFYVPSFSPISLVWAKAQNEKAS